MSDAFGPRVAGPGSGAKNKAAKFEQLGQPEPKPTIIKGKTT